MIDSPTARRQPPATSLHRRGGAYVLVLGAATMIAVVGLGALAASQSRSKSAAAARDWGRAGVLAEAAAETALARMNTKATWRTDIAGDEIEVINDRSRFASFQFEDAVDGNVDKGDQDPVIVHTLGRVGGSMRRFKFECRYEPPPTLDVLNYGLYCGAGCNTVSATVSGAPLGAAVLVNNGNLSADVRVNTLTNNGNIEGEVRTGQTPLTTFSDGTVTTAPGDAVTISYASIPSGTISNAVLTASVNPYGATSRSGVYVIRVPTLSTLTIHNSRIDATLIIELGLLSKLEIRGAVNWNRSGADYPALVVSSTVTASAYIAATGSVLTETTVNFNPAAAPFNGQSDSDTSDSYPNEIRGVVHFVGLVGVQIVAGKIVGTVIGESSMDLGAAIKVTYDPAVKQSPPKCYRTGIAGMRVVDGSWRWDVSP